MIPRETLISTFLAGSGRADHLRTALTGDASNRRYERLSCPQTGRTEILMDAPPATGEDVRPFIRIAGHLRQIGLSAPEIRACDADAGFLLLEDLGDDLFASLIARDPDLEPDLYGAATDVLIALRNTPPPDLKAPDAAELAAMTGLAFSHYATPIAGAPVEPAPFITAFRDTLGQHLTGPKVLALRDYHAENLIWLPGRSGVARVGLLDFQDAIVTHPAYDLVSLLQDARRDVPPATETAMIRYYIDQTGCDAAGFETAYALLGAQRNLRILGVFGRLSYQFGKPHYVDLIPRVWRQLMRDLDHPALTSVAGLLRTALPEPNYENLQRLKPR